MGSLERQLLRRQFAVMDDPDGRSGQRRMRNLKSSILIAVEPALFHLALRAKSTVATSTDRGTLIERGSESTSGNEPGTSDRLPAELPGQHVFYRAVAFASR